MMVALELWGGGGHGNPQHSERRGWLASNRLAVGGAEDGQGLALPTRQTAG